MKRIYLKKWVEVVLAIILVLSIFILAGECSDIRLFIGSKFVALITGMGSSYLLLKYGRFQSE